MDYNEKLKLAKEALDSGCYDRATIEHIFPELGESEDERIRKWLITQLEFKSDVNNPRDLESMILKAIAWLEKQVSPDMVADAYLKGCNDTEAKWLKKQGIDYSLVEEIEKRKGSFMREKEKAVSPNDKLSLGARIAILEELLVFAKEKQGEQAPTSDNIETKFHEGDWIVNERGTIRHIEAVDDLGYQTDGGWLTHAEYEKHFRLWQPIEDARNGDVLAVDPIEGYSSPFVCIYKRQNQEDSVDFDSHCFVAFDGKFYVGENGHSTEDIHPATKEQRDLLFAKMREAGYWWDAEYKELQKIEQKPAWSEEDEKMVSELQGVISLSRDIDWVYRLSGWLISLKDRINEK